MTNGVESLWVHEELDWKPDACHTLDWTCAAGSEGWVLLWDVVF